MSQMDGNHRYRPYYRTNRRYDDDRKHQYKKPNKHHYQYSSAPSSSSSSSSSRRGYRSYNDVPYRRTYRNDYHYQSTNSKSYSYYSSPPPPLMATKIPTPPPLPPPPPPPPSLPPSVVPHERESWIRSVKKTKTNESTEQKTQYLETMLRMPQQKSLLKSSRFDRMRFADNQLSNAIPTAITQDNIYQSSLHLIDDINNDEDICTIDRILSDNNEIPRPENPSDSLVNQPKTTALSGFLIDNCEDEEELPPFSPRPRPPPLSSDELISPNDEDTNQRRVMLVSELDAADAERRQELKRQKRLHRKLKKKNKPENPSTTSTIPDQDDQQEESVSDWMIEYDVNQISKLTDEVRRTSIAVTNEDKTEKMNLILTKIKKQQDELKKLKQYVMSMLGEQERPRSNRSNSNRTQDILLALLNQPIQSGCWLCSGKMYAEVATQCDDDNEQ